MRILCFIFMLAVPALAGEPASVVLEGGNERMEVSAASLADMTLTEREKDFADVYFALSPEDSARFEAMTRRLVGDHLRISVCGRVLAAPQVMLPIEGGQIVVTGGMDQMAVLFDALRATGDCPGGGS